MRPWPEEIVEKSELKKLVTLPGEKIIFARRKHRFVIVVPFLIAIILYTFFVTILFVVFILYRFNLFIFFLGFFSLTVAGLTALNKVLINWYYRLYIVTDRKIMEVNCSPLFSNHISDVLLDQVRITEVDVDIKGLINEFFDMGDVIITFDRPSHQEVITIADIRKPQEVENYLSNAFEQLMHETPVWFVKRKKDDTYKYGEDIEEEH